MRFGATPDSIKRRFEQAEALVPRPDFRLWTLRNPVKSTMERIEVNPAICSGKPVIRGTRIMVRNILGMAAGGIHDGENPRKLSGTH
jgi:hypothetical protein